MAPRKFIQQYAARKICLPEGFWAKDLNRFLGEDFSAPLLLPLVRGPSNAQQHCAEDFSLPRAFGIPPMIPGLSSQSTQKYHEVSLLRVREPHGKANVVELDDIHQPSRRAVMKLWGPGGQPSYEIGPLTLPMSAHYLL